jgi:oligosaccharide repeat unit polymerase
MFSLALALLIGIMLCMLRRHCFDQNRVHINPLFGLLMGSSYYIVLPCVFVGYFNELVSGITVYENYFTEHNAALVLVFWSLVLLSLNFGLGSRSLSRYIHTHRPSPPPVRQHVFVKKLVLFLYSGAILFMLSALKIKDSLFLGYDQAILDNEAIWQVRGTMSSLYSVMAVLQLMLLFFHWQNPLSRLQKSMMFLVFFSSSILLLSMGARLYVIMALLSGLALYSQRHSGIKIRHLLFISSLGLLLFGTIGVLRLGSLDGVAAVLLNVVTEPILTSISAFSLITDNPVPLLGQPHLFPVDFQAVVPSFLLPGKDQLFERLKEYGYAFEAPLGGYHIVFSLLINFGVIGTVFLAFFVGKFLKQNHPNNLQKKIFQHISAAALTGMFAFSLYRDPFFIGVVKNTMLVSVIIPYALSRLACPSPVVRYRNIGWQI